MLSCLFAVLALAKPPPDNSSGIQGVHHRLPALIGPLDPQGVNRVRFAEKNCQIVKYFLQSYHLDYSYSSKDTLPPDPKLRWLSPDEEFHLQPPVGGTVTGHKFWKLARNSPLILCFLNNKK